MQYAKKAGYYMGTKYTMEIRGRMGNPVSEKGPPGIPGKVNAGNRIILLLSR